MAELPSHRFSVDLSQGAFKTLADLARERGKSKRVVIQDSLALEQWFEEARKEGSRILVERDGEIREVIPR